MSVIEDCILNIKTFQTYLEHIVNSVETNNFHEDTIKKLSGTISQYYNDINLTEDESEDNNSDVQVIDYGSSEDSEIITIASSANNSDSSTDSSSDDDDSEMFQQNIFFSSNHNKEKEPNIIDKYLEDFKNDSLDNSNLNLYKNKDIHEIKLNNFLKFSCIY